MWEFVKDRLKTEEEILRICLSIWFIFLTPCSSLILVVLGAIAPIDLAQAAPLQEDSSLAAELSDDPMALISKRVAEQFDYAGLASFYSGVRYSIVHADGIRTVDEETGYSIPNGGWLAISGHFFVLAVKAGGLTLSVEDQAITFQNPERLLGNDVTIRLAEKNDISLVAPELGLVRYAHLWSPLAQAAKGVEALLVWLHGLLPGGWGITIIAFAILLRIFQLPIGFWTMRLQRNVGAIQARLEPKITEIKSQYKGEEAHNRIMDAHKAVGVTPFFALKPLMTNLIQIPILIVVFNTLGEMPQLAGETFLWIPDLAYPDSVARLPLWIPLFGDTLNPLPFVMTLVTILSTAMYKDQTAPPSEVKRQKRNLYLMAAGFFVLFYPFPAVMVLYWTVANILQTIQQQIWSHK